MMKLENKIENEIHRRNSLHKYCEKFKYYKDLGCSKEEAYRKAKMFYKKRK